MTPFGRPCRLGEPVRQTATHYDQGVCPGDPGWLSRIDLGNGRRSVRYEEGERGYQCSELDQLLPGRALWY